MTKTTLLMGFVDVENMFELVDGMVVNLDPESSGITFYKQMYDKYPEKFKGADRDFRVMRWGELPKKSYVYFCELIKDQYPQTDILQFTTRYIEIFNIIEPDANIITELI